MDKYVDSKNGIVLYNDDSLKIMDKMIENNIIVDMVFTDPPYRVTSRGSAGNSGGMLQKKINRKGQVFEHNDMKIEEFLPRLYNVLKDGGHCYIMTNNKNLTEYLRAIDEMYFNDDKNQKFYFIKSLIWDKGNKIMGQYYMSQFEYILFLRKGKGVKINNCGTSDILRIPNAKSKDGNGENLHDTEKPVELAKILIENSSNEGELVLDCFMGINGCGVAAKELKRKYIGIEIDKKYFDTSVDRVKG